MRLSHYRTSFAYVRSVARASPISFSLAAKSLDSLISSLTLAFGLLGSAVFDPLDMGYNNYGRGSLVAPAQSPYPQQRSVARSLVQFI